MLKKDMKFCISLLILLAHINVSFSQAVKESDGAFTDNKNLLYVQNFIIIPSLYYDRAIPISNNFGVIPKVGIGLFGIVPIIGTSFYYGKRRHFAELGTIYWAFEGLAINGNYRFQANNGLLFKLGLEYIPGEEAHPILGLGYSF